MFIDPTSIFVTSLIGLITFPRLLYFMISNIKRYPSTLFKGRYLFYFIMSFLFAVCSILSALFFSHNFYYNGLFICWCSLTLIFLCLYLVLWVMFWMHGYEARYQFEKFVLPCPMSILSFASLLISGLFTLNIYLIISSIIYFVFEYIWSYKGFMLTKPKKVIDENDLNNNL